MYSIFDFTRSYYRVLLQFIDPPQHRALQIFPSPPGGLTTAEVPCKILRPDASFYSDFLSRFIIRVQTYEISVFTVLGWTTSPCFFLFKLISCLNWNTRFKLNWSTPISEKETSSSLFEMLVYHSLIPQFYFIFLCHLFYSYYVSIL